MKTYGTLDIVGEDYKLDHLPPHVSMRLKRVFPRVPLEATQPFTMRGGSHLACEMQWFLQRYPMVMNDATRRHLDDGCAAYEHSQTEVLQVLAPDWKPTVNPSFKDGYAPRPYQAQAAEIARRLGRLLIMDDVGLGKTVTAIAAIADASHLPAAIVVQSHLAKQWATKYIKRFTNLRVHVIKGRTPCTLPDADVYIFKYSNISGWVDYAKAHPFKAVVFDEIQELRHGIKTAKGRAARAFTAGAKLRIGLSATPIYNYGFEMFHIIEAIEPGALGSETEFIVGWCRSQGGRWIVNDPVALGSHLRDLNLVIQRDEHDAGQPMPPPNILPVLVEHDESVAEASRELTRQLAMKVLTGSFHEKGQATRELDALVRRETGLAKAVPVAGYVRMLVEAGYSVLLSGWHRDVYDVWLRELKEFNPVLYTGSETEAKKNKARDDFIDGRAKILIISNRSGAGLDGLQHMCSKLVVGEFDHSPEVHKQLIGRLRRDGNQTQIDAFFPHANFGSDPGMIEMLGLKASQSHGIVKATETMTPQLSDFSRIERLAAKYLEGEIDPATIKAVYEPPQMALGLEAVA